MALYQPSKDLLLAAINAQNSLTIAASDIVYSAPKDIAGTPLGTANNSNTEIKVSANPAGSNWSDKNYFYYNRRKITDLPTLLGTTLAVGPSATKLYDAIPGLNNRYGFTFETGDLVNVDVGWNADKTSGTLTLTADPNSLGWIGSYTFSIVRGDESLAASIATPVLDGLKYPDGSLGSTTPTAIFGELYSYPYDFTAYKTQLLAMTPQVFNSVNQTLTDLVNYLVTVTGGGWTTTNNASNGLLGSELVSVGLNDSTTMPTNSNYKYVLVLKLPATLTSFSGKFYLQFNDPNDTSAV